MLRTGPYWFPAKRYGWGWGLPTTWEGWVVFVAFIVLLVLAGVAFPPRTKRPAFLACVLVLGGLLLTVCWLKGEPPHWRWGG